MSMRWASMVAVLVLAAVHLFASKVRLRGPLVHAALSAAAGISVAYVFIHILPALAEIQAAYIESHEQVFSWLDEQVYLAALLGLVAMYALDHLTYARRAEVAAFWVHTGAFALYNGVVGFYAARRQSPVGLAIATVAFGAHFLVNDKALERDFGEIYERYARPVIAAAIVAGWALGSFVPTSGLVAMWLFALLAGGILLNSLKEELPGKREGSLGAFLLGTFAYAALMLTMFFVSRTDLASTMARSPRTTPLPTLTWRQRHGRFWDSRAWFLPVLYVAAAALIGFRAPALGERFARSLVAPLSSASAIAALSAIASGMIALTAIVFSLVFVALQFGSANYSPRLLRVLSSRNLLSNALGVFAGTFVYALVALRAVDIGGTTGINAIAVSLAWLWLLASVAMLILLIPKVQSLSLVRVLPLIGHQSERAIAALYPARFEETKVIEPRRDLRAGQEIRHEGAPGYLAAIDVRRLVALAGQVDGFLSIPHAVGDFVLRGEPIAVVSNAKAELPARKVRGALVIEPYRFVELDPAYGIRLLVDIAIRALSPAINDPTTAVMVLDNLELLLRKLGTVDLDVGYVRDEAAVPRLLFPTPTWEELLLLGLLEIQLYGRDSVTVERRLGALVRNLERSVPEPRRAAVRRLIAHREKLVRQTFTDDLDALREAEAADSQGLGHAQVAPPMDARPDGQG